MPRTQFRKDFELLTGASPFRWQERLFERFAAADLPPAVDVPTGLGKTMTMALWLLARAQNASLPRRLAYVVDRRAVVDQATEEAERIRRNLLRPELAHAAASLGVGPEYPLPISTLRGQLADNRLWLEDPAKVAIIVGTVDMIGSRLLFEGYGVSREMRPYHAGLLGSDTLVLLDEAHLCEPFEALLCALRNRVELHPQPKLRAAVPRFHTISLSATRSSQGAGFALEPEDTDQTLEPVAHQRFNAVKKIRMEQIASKELAEWLVVRALDMPPGRIAVFCDRRKVAMEVVKRLRTRTVGTLTGARRGYERAQAAAWLLENGYQGKPASQSSFLVATSAGEVGVDFDADHAVCDLVSFERMAQRLGRVNRRGGPSRVGRVEVAWYQPAEPAKPKQEKLGEYLAECVLLEARKRAIEALPELEADWRDASPRALGTLRESARGLVENATSRGVRWPGLDRATAEAWSLSSLREYPGRAAPQPWIRGWVPEEEGEATVLWRKSLPWRNDEKDPIPAEVEAFFEEAAPHPLETLQAPASETAATVIARANASGGGAGDTQSGAILLSQGLEFVEAWTRAKIAQKQREDLRDQLAGRVLVLSSDFGGLNEQGQLDESSADEVSCLDNGWDENIVTGVGIRILAPGAICAEDWRPVYQFSLAQGDSGQARDLTVVALRQERGSAAGEAAVARRNQSLTEHTCWVEDEIAATAAALRLPEKYREALGTAARLHDLGKSRQLWQDAMGAPRANRPYAKTKGPAAPARLRIGGDTYRHEFGSLAEAERDPQVQALPPEMRDLVLHLIACHHGHARPVLAAADPDLPPSSPELGERALETALRFARLQKDWGPWGLAWWETLFRAADQRASRRLSRNAIAAGGGR